MRGCGAALVVAAIAPGTTTWVAPTGTIEAPLVQGVDTDRRAAVLFPDQPGIPQLTCTSPPPSGSWQVSAVAADGTATCLGQATGRAP